MDSDRGGGGSDRKRRKRDHGDLSMQQNDHEEVVEEDVSEEEKMKAFFDLIQAARGARERLFGRKTADGEDDNSRRQTAMPRVWNPTFQARDFADDPGKDIAEVPGAATGGGPLRQLANPGEQGEGKDEDEGRMMKLDGEGNDVGVNLKLSL